ncbi:MAG: hypothetical protein AAGH90_02880 [Pseudomonadota bacterium]
MSLTVLALFGLPFHQSASAEIAAEEQMRLNACIRLVETDPRAAYEDSLAWLGNGNRPRARYCNAKALLGLGYTEEGAARLEALANAPDAIALDRRAEYMAEAGNAWFSASYPDAAIKAFSEAIEIDPRNGDYYKDRAAAFLALEKWFEAIDDLEIALQLQPNNPEALFFRSRAYFGLEDFTQAQRDIQAARVGDPENVDYALQRGHIREQIRLRQER